MGMNLLIDVVFRNDDSVAHDYTYDLQVDSQIYTGAHLGSVCLPDNQRLTIGANSSVMLGWEVPWEQIKPWVRQTEFVEILAVLKRHDEDLHSFESSVVLVEGVPFHIAALPARHVRRGEAVDVLVSYANPLATPLSNANIRIDFGQGLSVNGQAAKKVERRLPPIPPFTAGVFRFSLIASEPGQVYMGADINAPNAAWSRDSAFLNVVDCPADFDLNAVTDSRDLFGFVDALLGCTFSADRNKDGVVDFEDLALFRTDYAAGCP